MNRWRRNPGEPIGGLRCTIFSTYFREAHTHASGIGIFLDRVIFSDECISDAGRSCDGEQAGRRAPVRPGLVGRPRPDSDPRSLDPKSPRLLPETSPGDP